MQQWEYMNAWVSSPITTPENMHGHVKHAEEMARFGNDGWEMTAIMVIEYQGYLAFFKRPKQDLTPYRG